MSWSVLHTLALGAGYAVLAVVFAVNTYYLALVVLGFQQTGRAIHEVLLPDARRVLRSPLTPPISVLAPAFNEEANVVENVRSLLMLNYPLFEVVVINDGSKDGTLDRLVTEFGLQRSNRSFERAVACCPIRGVYESRAYPNLTVVDKENGGKADALNAGINLALYPIFCAIDADSILESEALLRLVRPFVEAPGVTVAAGGVVRVANGCEVRAGRLREVHLTRHPLVICQVVEYLRAFLFGRMGWSGGNGLLVISGAFGMFDKRTVIGVGGYARDTVGEDMELVVRMHRRLREAGRSYRIAFVPDPICWTEVPETLGTLRRQRTRWQRGLIDTLVRHRVMIGNPRYGVAGTLAMTSFALIEMFGPVAEAAGYLLVPLLWLAHLLDTEFAMTFFVAAVLYGIVVSAAAVLLEDLAFRRYARLGDLALLLAAAVLENFGYRQLTVWWRVQAFWQYWRKDMSWGHMERRGIGTASASGVH